jgi:hypothetical protein
MGRLRKALKFSGAHIMGIDDERCAQAVRISSVAQSEPFEARSFKLMSMTADHGFEDPGGHAMHIRLDASRRT